MTLADVTEKAAASLELEGALQILPPATRPTPVSADAPVVRNEPLTDRYWLLELEQPHVAAYATPGQFTMLTVTRGRNAGPVLPRPMAVYDTDRHAGTFQVVYSVVGSGTKALTTFRRGDTIGAVGPLGQGFQLPTDGDVLLLGRGIGTCSLMPIAGALSSRAVVTAVTSGRHAEAIVGVDRYERRGARVVAVHDQDGSSDPTALYDRLTDELDGAPPRLIAACGSRRLEALALRLARRWRSDVQVAVEAHMACGLGYCHGCSNGDRSDGAEAPLICKDGPVFRYVAA